MNMMKLVFRRKAFSACLTNARSFAVEVERKFVKLEQLDETVILKLSDPSRMNAMTVEMGREFNEVLKDIEFDVNQQKVRSVIITGDGDKAFSAGGDLDWLEDRHYCPAYKNSVIMRDFYNNFLDVRKLSVPTIAALNGAAVGAGMAMSLACDVRIVSEAAKLGFTFPSLGIHPGMGSSLLLPRISSYEVAAHLLSSGVLIRGNEAKERGLVLRVVEPVRASFHFNSKNRCTFKTS